MMEAIQIRYTKWTLKLRKTTLEYIVLFGTNAHNTYVDAAKRTLKFEEKMIKRDREDLSHVCRNMCISQSQRRSRVW